MRWASVGILGVCFLLVGQAAWGAISSSNVLVLYNPAWTDGTHSGDYLANYYAGQRNVPASNVIGITGLGTGEEISANDYLNIIWPQVQSALATRTIDVIVTTKGLPLRIRNDLPNPAAATGYYVYTDPSGVQHTLERDGWKQYSSLESELTRISTIGVRSGSNWLNMALVQMGDQMFYDTSVPNASANPYYRKNTAFSHSNSTYGGLYLTSRLDGFNVNDVTTSINKAKQAFLIPNSCYVVMDDENNPNLVDRMTYLKTVLVAKNQKYVYDNTPTAITTAPGLVMGYVSHGVHGSGLNSGYIPYQLSFGLANGSVFETHESFNAYSFQLGGNRAGQGLVAEWIAKGGTAGVGNVEEPQAGADYEANEDQMFKMLLNGYSWGEAAWSSLREVSFVNTVVGDPLMTWRTLISGDANMDGRVGSADLALLGANWGATGQAGGALWGYGDFNCDGVVGSADLALLGSNWGQVASWVASGGESEGPFDPTNIPGDPSDIPEPSTLALAMAGLAIAAVGLRWRGRRRGDVELAPCPRMRGFVF